MGVILLDTRASDQGDDLIDMVEEAFGLAQQVLGHSNARRYMRLREQDLYRHLDASGLEHRVPAARRVYAAFWRLHADV